jgi:hypothetical protein
VDETPAERARSRASACSGERAVVGLAGRQDLRTLRYLRASKWQKYFAIQKLENTLRWRREFGIYSHLTADYIADEVRSGYATRFALLHKLHSAFS